MRRAVFDLSREELLQQIYLADGEGVRIGVIDTGICQKHPMLCHRIVSCRNCTPENTVEDQNGHGTHVAGLIASSGYGISPRSALYIAKAFTKNGYAKQSSIEDAISWLRKQQVFVINLSFCPCRSDLRLPQLSKQIIVGVAGWKEAKRQMLTAVAVDHGGVPLSDSYAQFALPGNNILSTYKNCSYARLSGSSMAAAYLTGMIARIQQIAKWTEGRYLEKEEMIAILCRIARFGPYLATVCQYGYLNIPCRI